MLNSAVQAVLNATDTWFIGRLSPAATAAIGAVYWPILVFVLLFGGVGLSVQTSVAQAYGGHRYRRASQATWTSLWASLFTVPVFIALSLTGSSIFAPFPHSRGDLPSCSRILVSTHARRPARHRPVVAARLFNGIGRPTITLWVTVSVAAANAMLNQVFMFDWGWGIAGSGWATDAAQFVGVAAAALLFLGEEDAAALRLAPHDAAACAVPAPAIPIGVSHGIAGCGGHPWLCAVSVDASASGHRRRCVGRRSS